MHFNDRYKIIYTAEITIGGKLGLCGDCRALSQDTGINFEEEKK